MKNKNQFPHVEWHWKPVLLARLLNHWEIKAPADIAPKRQYLFKQCMRYAVKNAIAFLPPNIHPFNPTYALRIACRNSHRDQSTQEKIINLLWQNIWGEGKNADDPNEIVTWLNNANFEGTHLLEKSFAKDVKDELKFNTAEAISLGAFGVPTVVVTNSENLTELFWGNDAWPDIVNFLQGKDQLDRNLYDKIITENIKGSSQKLNI